MSGGGWGGVWEFLGTLAWAVVAAGAVWRAEPLVAAWIDAWREGRASALPEPPVPIPDDLIALANTHSEEFAREDTLKLAREKYEELRDWDQVRAAFGLGRLH